MSLSAPSRNMKRWQEAHFRTSPSMFAMTSCAYPIPTSSWNAHDEGHHSGRGAGSRLYPLTLVASKQLQAVYDKPMIYYPLTVLIASGIRQFCLITTPQDLPRFEALLGDGSRWGISIEYREQPRQTALRRPLSLPRLHWQDKVVLMLGDNIFRR